MGPRPRGRISPGSRRRRKWFLVTGILSTAMTLAPLLPITAPITSAASWHRIHVCPLYLLIPWVTRSLFRPISSAPAPHGRSTSPLPRRRRRSCFVTDLATQGTRARAASLVNSTTRGAKTRGERATRPRHRRLTSPSCSTTRSVSPRTSPPHPSRRS